MEEAIDVAGLFLVVLLYIALEGFFPCPLAPESQAVFTQEDLKWHDGRHGTSYTACNGLVFDVSKSPHENPLSLHHLLKGKDASMVLATMDFASQRLLTDRPKFDNLTEKAKKNLREWEDIYRKRYTVVGKMDYAVSDNQ